MSLTTEVDANTENAVSRSRSIDFRFLPKELTNKCRQVIEIYHRVHGYSRLAHILWRDETREFIALHQTLHAIYRKASITRGAKKANEYYVLVATVILSIEILASGLAGWDQRFPLAKRKAGLLLTKYLPNSRTRLMGIYLFDHWADVKPALLQAISPSTQK